MSRTLLTTPALTGLLAMLSLLPVATAQRGRAPVTPPVTGSLFGYVGYSDTKTPARLAQVMLIKVYPVELPTDVRPAQPQAIAGVAAAALTTFTQTGLDGHFQMPAVAIGKYIVLAQQNGALNPIARIDLDALNKIKTGHLTEDQIKDHLADLTVVTIEEGKTVTASVTLTHGASISGTLSYADGSPAVGVQVHLLAKSSSGIFQEPDIMTLGMASTSTTLGGSATDEAGRFHITGLPPGTYAVRADLPLGLLKNLGTSFKGILALGMSSPDSLGSATKYDSGLSVYSGNVLFRKDLKPFELGDGASFTGANITIPLNGMYSVQAQVKDAATGKPLDMAQVQLMDADGNEILRAQFVDDNGNCIFEYVPAGQYTLSVVNAMDLSGVGKMLDKNYDPKKAVHYSAASLKVRVSDNTEGIVLQVSKPAPAQVPQAVAGDAATADMAAAAEDTRNAGIASGYVAQLAGAGDVGATRLAASRAAMTTDTAAAAAETAAAAVESDASQATAALAAGDRASVNNARDKAASDYSALLVADDRLAKAATDLVTAAKGNAAINASRPGSAAINGLGAQDSSAAANLLSAATKGGTAGYSAAAANEATAINDANTIAGLDSTRTPTFQAAAKAEAEAQSCATAAAAGGSASAAAAALAAAATAAATADGDGNPFAGAVEFGAAAVANAASATLSAQHVMDQLKNAQMVQH